MWISGLVKCEVSGHPAAYLSINDHFSWESEVAERVFGERTEKDINHRGDIEGGSSREEEVLGYLLSVKMRGMR
jgi:hypothetical protein